MLIRRVRGKTRSIEWFRVKSGERGQLARPPDNSEKKDFERLTNELGGVVSSSEDRVGRKILHKLANLWFVSEKYRGFELDCFLGRNLSGYIISCECNVSRIMKPSSKWLDRMDSGGKKCSHTWMCCVRRALFENANILLFLLENYQERVKNPNDFNFSIRDSKLALFLSLFLFFSLCQEYSVLWRRKRVAAINRHRSWREFASNLVSPLSLSFLQF